MVYSRKIGLGKQRQKAAVAAIVMCLTTSKRNKDIFIY